MNPVPVSGVVHAMHQPGLAPGTLQASLCWTYGPAHGKQGDGGTHWANNNENFNSKML